MPRPDTTSPRSSTGSPFTRSQAAANDGADSARDAAGPQRRQRTPGATAPGASANPSSRARHHARQRPRDRRRVLVAQAGENQRRAAGPEEVFPRARQGRRGLGVVRAVHHDGGRPANDLETTGPAGPGKTPAHRLLRNPPAAPTQSGEQPGREGGVLPLMATPEGDPERMSPRLQNETFPRGGRTAGRRENPNPGSRSARRPPRPTDAIRAKGNKAGFESGPCPGGRFRASHGKCAAAWAPASPVIVADGRDDRRFGRGEGVRRVPTAPQPGFQNGDVDPGFGEPQESDQRLDFKFREAPRRRAGAPREAGRHGPGRFAAVDARALFGRHQMGDV
jgi:hypothetical protein